MLKDTIDIWADTSLKILINEQKKAFENGYNNPYLNIHYYYEAAIVDRLMQNKLNCAVLQRKLTSNESEFIKGKEDFLPKQYTIAYDAYAFIANKNSNIKSLSEADVRNYFTNGRAADFQLVFENNSCQAIPYFQSYFKLNTKQMTAAFAKSNLSELIEFLKKDAGSIGIIPFSYISDIEAVSTIELLKDLKVLSITCKDSMKKPIMVNPSQESIATKAYPYVTPIVLVNCNIEKKSGTTFVNYILKPKAQRLFLKCGMVPAVFPAREVNINSN